jgi:hypothetical protein
MRTGKSSPICKSCRPKRSRRPLIYQAERLAFYSLDLFGRNITERIEAWVISTAGRINRLRD